MTPQLNIEISAPVSFEASTYQEFSPCPCRVIVQSAVVPEPGFGVAKYVSSCPISRVAIGLMSAMHTSSGASRNGVAGGAGRRPDVGHLGVSLRAATLALME